MHRFKLEALLNHRRHQEEVCHKELAETERLLVAEKGKLRSHKREYRENIQKLQAKQKARLNVADIILAMDFIQQLAKNIENQQKCVRKATKTVNQKRNELILIVKKRKTLEKLKEKEWLAYQKKMMQNDRKLMDELASMRHARKT